MTWFCSLSASHCGLWVWIHSLFQPLTSEFWMHVCTRASLYVTLLWGVNVCVRASCLSGIYCQFFFKLVPNWQEKHRRRKREDENSRGHIKGQKGNRYKEEREGGSQGRGQKETVTCWKVTDRRVKKGRRQVAGRGWTERGQRKNIYGEERRGEERRGGERKERKGKERKGKES